MARVGVEVTIKTTAWFSDEDEDWPANIEYVKRIVSGAISRDEFAYEILGINGGPAGPDHADYTLRYVEDPDNS